MSTGLVHYGTLSKKKRIHWETQLFAFVRSFKDGITFFKFNINWDRYESDHSPAFQIELTILNCYNHLLIYQNNYENDLLKHLTFWHNKTDDECIEMATSETGVNAEQALKNMLERDFVMEMNKNIVDELKNL